jgi:hypothetical protein
MFKLRYIVSMKNIPFFDIKFLMKVKQYQTQDSECVYFHYKISNSIIASTSFNRFCTEHTLIQCRLLITNNKRKINFYIYKWISFADQP